MNNKVKNVIIIILAVLVLGLGGYLVYEKMLSNDNGEGLENNQEIKEENYDLALAEELINNIENSGVYDIFDKLSDSGLTDEIKLSLAINKVSPEKKYTCSDAFDMNSGEFYMFGTVWGCSKTSAIDSYSYNNVNEQYRKLFGATNNAPKIGVLTTWAYDYSSKIDSYVSLNPHFGPIMKKSYYYDIESAKVINDKLDIKVLYLSYLDKAPLNGGLTYTINNVEYNASTEEEVKNAYNSNKVLLPRLTFTYEKQNDSYVLISVN